MSFVLYFVATHISTFRFAHNLLIVNKNTDFVCMLYKQTERFENILRGLLPECLYVTTKNWEKHSRDYGILKEENMHTRLNAYCS